MRVTCVVEFLPSYLGHMLSTARVGFESDYSDKYHSTVRGKDLDWLRENEDLFKWGNGKAGPLTAYGLFLLGYVSPQGPLGIESYYDSLLEMARSSDVSKLFASFPSLERLHRIWGPLDDPRAVGMLKALSGEIEELKRILVDNWESFEENVWPQEEPKVTARAEETNARLRKTDLIESWENATGFEFKAERYEYVLSSGMENAPRFNSLGYGRNWVYYDIPLLFEGILHEIGSHVLIDLQRDFREECDDFQLLYNVRETLCSHLTKVIFGEQGVQCTPLDGSAVFDPRADELFGERIDSVPVKDLRVLFGEVLGRLEEE